MALEKKDDAETLSPQRKRGEEMRLRQLNRGAGRKPLRASARSAPLRRIFLLHRKAIAMALEKKDDAETLSPQRKRGEEMRLRRLNRGGGRKPLRASARSAPLRQIFLSHRKAMAMALEKKMTQRR
jgi:hypothetical protein